MKIGILTLHYGTNYGGTLQCIALFNILKGNGHDVDVIDFRPEIICPLYKRLLYNLSSIRSFSDLYGLYRHNHNKTSQSLNQDLCHIFDIFRKKYLSFSPRCNELSISEVVKSYDAIIVGSDQVWSSTTRSHLTYMGDWGTLFKGRLYSYAACATMITYPIVRKSQIKRLLNRFCTISVRDEISQCFVSQFIQNKTIRIDLDPTLLYSFDWMLPNGRPSENYILVYVLGKEISGGNATAINRIKQFVDKNIKVIAITIYNEDICYADKTIRTASPAEWIWYIKNAQFVFTDSFHGEVFSIKFNKDFYVYYTEPHRASRIIDLSRMFNVEDRMITDVDSIDGQFNRLIDKIDYNKYRNASLSYLNDIG